MQALHAVPTHPAFFFFFQSTYCVSRSESPAIPPPVPQRVPSDWRPPRSKSNEQHGSANQRFPDHTSSAHGLNRLCVVLTVATAPLWSRLRFLLLSTARPQLSDGDALPPFLLSWRDRVVCHWWWPSSSARGKSRNQRFVIYSVLRTI